MLKNENSSLRSRTARPCQDLRQMLIQLLREKELEKITVTELCRAVKINRSTFYEYYEDIYDLMEDAQNNFLTEADSLGAYIAKNTLPPEEVISLILTFICSRKEILLLFLSNYRYIPVLRTLHEKVLSLFRLKLYQNYTLPDDINKDLLENAILFLSSGFYSLYLQWIRTECKESPDILVRQSVALSQSCLNSLFAVSSSPVPREP